MLVETWHASNGRLNADAIVPVPLHPDRLAERGHNQADVLARALSKQVGIAVESNAIARVRAGSRRRIGASRESRAKESAKAFRAAARIVAGKRLLLVDDVFTSGATLGACGAALMEAGAMEVVAITAARVRLGSAF